MADGSPRMYDALVVDDDPVLSRKLAQLAGRDFRPQVAASVAAARALIPTIPRLRAAILDFELPDGTGLDIITALREANVRIPMLLLTAHFDRDLALTAQDRGAEYAVKPASFERITAFLTAAHASALAREKDENLDVAAKIAARFSLSKQEAQLLSLYASGTARNELAEAMGVSENTVKTVVRRILWKCGYVGELRDVLDAWRDGEPNRIVS